MLKIFDDQVVGKLREDREQLMNAGPSNWGIAKINAEPVITSVNDLRSRQKQMLGGYYLFSSCTRNIMNQYCICFRTR